MGKEKVKYVLSDRQLRRILKRVDKQRVIAVLGAGMSNVRPIPMIEYGIPYNDEEFSCGLLTCEFRGWVESFGEEIPIKNMLTGQEADNHRFRITQAGRAVLDRTQAIANFAVFVAAVGFLVSSASLLINLRTNISQRSQTRHIPHLLIRASSPLPSDKSPDH